jgi:hypothetical protein
MTKDEKKELIKLAAKASRIDIDKFTGWNPIDDDADAFKLAVKLEFDIQQDTDNVHAEFVTVDVDDDRFAATRLAITQAAAEIGKTRR